MNGLLGHLAVLAALAVAMFGAIAGLAGGLTGQAMLRQRARQACYAYLGCMAAANLVMVAALLSHDFSVGYVAQVGSRATPWVYTIVSLWSSLEGSILFWGLVLGAYGAAFARRLGEGHPRAGAYALAVLLVVAAFFAFLIAAPADPFRAVTPAPSDGPGPNPLLQNHILMVIHPPLLYLGYVGMTIPFAAAMAALMAGELTTGWLKVIRGWTLVPWLFLSVGIILGSWWAYEVLGWGGYWAWDPVENASFLPWLTATAYLHATVVQERRRILRAWTVALVLSTFLLTILGTFMTRSGVFNSVHSFTQSSIGPAFLGFLAVMTAWALALVVARGHLLGDEGHVEAPVSREAAFLLNNVLFVVFTLTVLLGTVYPLVAEAVGGGKVSVGEPYFDRMALPIGLAMVFLMGVGPVLPWGRPQLGRVIADFVAPSAVGLALAAGLAAAGVQGGMALSCFALCGFATVVTCRELVMPAWTRAKARRMPFWPLWGQYLAGNRRRVGGYIVHLAVIMVVAAIAASQSYRQVHEAMLKVDESMAIGPYTITFLRAELRREPQRDAVVAAVKVASGGHVLGRMEPRLNFYPSQREPVGTPHVITRHNSDLYLSLLHVARDGSEVSIKAYHIPMVAWIWRSLPLWVVGAAVGLWPRRRSPGALAPSGAAAPAVGA